MVDFLLQTINGNVEIYRGATSPGKTVSFLNKSGKTIYLLFTSDAIFGAKEIPIHANFAPTELTVRAGAFGDYTFGIYEFPPAPGSIPTTESQIAVSLTGNNYLHFTYEVVGGIHNLSIGTLVRAGDPVNFNTNPEGTVFLDFSNGNPLRNSAGRLPPILEVDKNCQTTVDATAAPGAYAFTATVTDPSGILQSGGTLQGDIIVEPPNDYCSR